MNTNRTLGRAARTVAGGVVAALVAGLAVVATAGPASAATCANGLTPASPSPTGSGWLYELNQARAAFNLAPVSEDTCLSAADALHAHYMAGNRIVTHVEDSSNALYTAAGATAGQQSAITGAASSLADGGVQGVRALLSVPYHALGLLDPAVTTVGYAQETGSDGLGYAALDVLSSVPTDYFARLALYPTTNWPRVWPSNAQDLAAGQTTLGNEIENPTRECAAATGASYGQTILMSTGVLGTAFPDGLDLNGDGIPDTNSLDVFGLSGSLTESGTGSVPFCLLSKNVVMSDSRTQTVTAWPSAPTTTETAWLNAAGSVALIPLRPLVAGKHYTGSITAQTDHGTFTFPIDFGVARPATGVQITSDGSLSDSNPVLSGTVSGVPAGATLTVESSPNGQAPWTPVATSDPVTASSAWTATIPSFTGSTYLRARYTGSDTAGSSVSAPISATWVAVPPAAPENVDAVQAPSYGLGVHVTWTQPSGGGAVSGYQVRTYTLDSAGNPSLTATANVGNTLAADLSVPAYNRSYEFTVTAFNGATPSVESAASLAIPVVGLPVANGTITTTVTAGTVYVSLPQALTYGVNVNEYQISLTCRMVATGANCSPFPQTLSAPADPNAPVTTSFAVPTSGSWVGSVSATAVSIAGNTTYPNKDVSYGVVTTSHLSARASASTVKYGYATRVYLTLTATPGETFKQVTATFTPSRTGHVALTYYYLVYPTYTGSGTYTTSFATTVHETGVWRFSYTGSSDDTAASTATAIYAQTTISGYVTKSLTIRHGSLVKNTIYVRPGLSRYVYLQYKVYGSRSWRNYKVYRTSSKNTVALAYPAIRGRVYYRVYAPATKAGLAAVSAARYVRGT